MGGVWNWPVGPLGVLESSEALEALGKGLESAGCSAPGRQSERGGAEGCKAARISTLGGSRPGEGADGGAVEPRGSNFLVVSWGNLEQDWRCLLSKQGKETPRPGR